MEEAKYIIVIGASAGGIPAITTVCAQLPKDLPAAVFVVLHMSPRSSAHNLAQIFQRQTALECRVAEEGAPILPGRLYIAPPNHHLLIREGSMTINQGTRENKYRPSIDVLFRSAAVAYRSRVIGIVLTGLLDDGTSGMYAVKRCGGTAIVQDPEEAQYDDMPQSVLNRLAVDHILPLSGIGRILTELVERMPATAPEIPRELIIEAQITANMTTTIDQLKQIGEKSDFACPDCGGGLYAVKNDPAHRYRCHTGHVYTENLLHDLQALQLEESVWVSIRMLEERHNMLLLMARHADEAGQEIMAGSHRERVTEIDQHIAQLKRLLARLTDDLPPG